MSHRTTGDVSEIAITDLSGRNSYNCILVTSTACDMEEPVVVLFEATFYFFESSNVPPFFSLDLVFGGVFSSLET